MDADRLVTMLNQIAAFHRRKPAADAAIEVATHVERFWEKRMTLAAYAHLDAGGAGLDPNAAAGLALLRSQVIDPAKHADLSSPLEA